MGDWSYRGQGPQEGALLRRGGEGSLSGGWKDGYVSECWERRAIDGPYSIDGIRTRLAVLENYGSLSQEGRLESQVTH